MPDKTALGVTRTNGNSIKWGAIAGAIVAAATALSAALSTGLLKPPPEIEHIVPWVTFVLATIVVVGAAVGIPSYHAGKSPDAPHG